MSEIGFVCVCVSGLDSVMDFLSFLHFTPRPSEKEEREMSQANAHFRGHDHFGWMDRWMDRWMDGWGEGRALNISINKRHQLGRRLFDSRLALAISR